MINMLSHVLFSYAAFDFPIHTLRLLHSLALASQFTLCTPFASVLSGFSTNTVFNVSLSFPVVRDTCPVSRKIKRNLKERRKLYFFLVYTLLNSSRARSRLRLLQYFLTFGDICFFFCFSSFIIPTTLQAHATAATLPEHSVEGPLGHR